MIVKCQRFMKLWKILFIANGYASTVVLFIYVLCWKFC